MSYRDALLSKLQARLAKVPGREGDAAINQRLAAPQRNVIPARAQLPLAGQVALMKEQLAAVQASVAEVTRADEIPAAVADYLRQNNLPARAKLAPTPELTDLPWDKTSLEISSGVADGSELASVTLPFAGVAETGTLVLLSGAEAATTLSFLPDYNIAVLRVSRLVGCYEEVFDRLRQVYGAGVMPRAFNFITGPSRTGDIEQKIELGAHGPRRLHVILVRDDGQT